MPMVGLQKVLQNSRYVGELKAVASPGRRLGGRVSPSYFNNRFLDVSEFEDKSM